jgi:hypothetical protein
MNRHLGSSLQPRRGYIADAPVPLNESRGYNQKQWNQVEYDIHIYPLYIVFSLVQGHHRAGSNDVLYPKDVIQPDNNACWGCPVYQPGDYERLTCWVPVEHSLSIFNDEIQMITNRRTQTIVWEAQSYIKVTIKQRLRQTSAHAAEGGQNASDNTQKSWWHLWATSSLKLIALVPFAVRTLYISWVPKQHSYRMTDWGLSAGYALARAKKSGGVRYGFRGCIQVLQAWSSSNRVSFRLIPWLDDSEVLNHTSLPLDL